jgi:hypothetical protein
MYHNPDPVFAFWHNWICNSPSIDAFSKQPSPKIVSLILGDERNYRGYKPIGDIFAWIGYVDGSVSLDLLPDWMLEETLKKVCRQYRQSLPSLERENQIMSPCQTRRAWILTSSPSGLERIL